MENQFSGKAVCYDFARPRYPHEFFEFLESLGFRGKTAADIGSGGGIMSEGLLNLDCIVYGIEPNDDMRCIAENKFNGNERFISVNAAAENTGLAGLSIDFAVCAQSFHWFNTMKFKNECRRIIKNDGKVFLIWNLRDETNAVIKANERLCAEYCPQFKGFSGGVDKINEKVSLFFEGEYKTIRYENSLMYDKRQFTCRNLSSSYAPKQEDSNYRAYKQALERFFEAHSQNGILRFPNQAVVYYGKV